MNEEQLKAYLAENEQRLKQMQMALERVKVDVSGQKKMVELVKKQIEALKDA